MSALKTTVAMKYLPDPSETAAASISCAGCARSTKCSLVKADAGCSSYLALASTLADLPEAVFSLLVESVGATKNKQLPLQTMMAIGQVFLRAGQAQRRLNDAYDSLKLFNVYHVRCAGRGAYLHNYMRMVLANAYEEDGELRLVFVKPGSGNHRGMGVTITAPRRIKLKRPVNADAGQTIYTEEEWEVASAEMIEAGLIVDPTVQDTLKRSRDKQLAAQFASVKPGRRGEARATAEALGILDAEMLAELTAERGSNDDYSGKSDYVPTDADRKPKRHKPEDDDYTGEVDQDDAAANWLREHGGIDPDDEDAEETPEARGLTGQLTDFGADADAVAQGMRNEAAELGIEDDLLASMGL